MNDIDYCYDLLLKHIKKSLEDEYCFYRYQIADKEINSDGKTSNYIKEQVCDLFNIKAAKDTMELLIKLSDRQSSTDDQQTGVIILPEVREPSDCEVIEPGEETYSAKEQSSEQVPDQTSEQTSEQSRESSPESSSEQTSEQSSEQDLTCQPYPEPNCKQVYKHKAFNLNSNKSGFT